MDSSDEPRRTRRTVLRAALAGSIPLALTASRFHVVGAQWPSGSDENSFPPELFKTGWAFVPTKMTIQQGEEGYNEVRFNFTIVNTYNTGLRAEFEAAAFLLDTNGERHKGTSIYMLRNVVLPSQGVEGVVGVEWPVDVEPDSIVIQISDYTDWSGLEFDYPVIDQGEIASTLLLSGGEMRSFREPLTVEGKFTLTFMELLVIPEEPVRISNVELRAFDRHTALLEVVYRVENLSHEKLYADQVISMELTQPTAEYVTPGEHRTNNRYVEKIDAKYEPQFVVPGSGSERWFWKRFRFDPAVEETIITVHTQPDTGPTLYSITAEDLAGSGQLLDQLLIAAGLFLRENDEETRGAFDAIPDVFYVDDVIVVDEGRAVVDGWVELEFIDNRWQASDFDPRFPAQ